MFDFYKKLQEMKNLPIGWRFGIGIPPMYAVIRIAEELYETYPSIHKGNVDLFPGCDGSLMCVFYFGKNCVEYVISSLGKVARCSLEEEDGSSISIGTKKSDHLLNKLQFF